MFRVFVGFAIGIIIARNAAAMSEPVAGAVIIFAIIAAAFAYIFGKRDKNTAVATAVAVANANAAARAQAVANSMVQIVMQSGQAPSPEEYRAIAEYHDGEVSNDNDRHSITSSSQHQRIGLRELVSPHPLKRGDL